MLKKACLFLLCLLSWVSSYAGEINQIVFFGDSLSDNGNLYRALLGVLPKSPPYFEGRFSNGPTWAEHVDHYYYNKSYINSKIYAWGGATAIFHFPTTKFIAPTNLELEIDKYLIDSVFKDKSKTLFVIWIGGNDYLFYSNENANTITEKVVDKIAWAINTLNSYGATHFLILNMPDLSRVPLARINNSVDKLHLLSMIHNFRLDQAIQQIQSSHAEIKIKPINIYDIFNDVIDHPDKYNNKYHIHIVNTANGCWTGSIFEKNTLSTKVLNKEITRVFEAKNQTLTHTDKIDTQAVSNFIINNPSLNYVYTLNQAWALGSVPCANPNQYLFWDNIHPSALTHDILASMVIEAVGDL